MAVPLVVFDHTICVTCEEELIVFRELDACDSCAVVVHDVDWLAVLAIQLENPDFVVQIATNVEEHEILGALVAEVCEQIVEILLHVLISQHQVKWLLSDVSV